MDKLRNQSFTMKFHLKNIRKKLIQFDEDMPDIGDSEYFYKVDLYIEYGNKHYLLGAITDEEESIKSFIESVKMDLVSNLKFAYKK